MPFVADVAWLAGIVAIAKIRKVSNFNKTSIYAAICAAHSPQINQQVMQQVTQQITLMSISLNYLILYPIIIYPSFIAAGKLRGIASKCKLLMIPIQCVWQKFADVLAGQFFVCRPEAAGTFGRQAWSVPPPPNANYCQTRCSIL